MAIRIPTNMNFHGRDSATSLLIGQTIKLLFFLIVLPALINITLHGHTCNAVIQTATTNCNSNSYTPGSTFERNLKKILDSLGQAANQSGFNISVSGGVHGLFQCRADLTIDQCDACWQWATTCIRLKCGNSVGASTWPFHCFLRYENYSFIGKLHTGLGSNFAERFGHRATGVFIPSDFQAAAKNLLNNLAGKAASETKRYAYGTALDSLFQTTYGLVQCTRDLNSDDCNACLSYSINKIFISHPGSAGVQYWSQSCILRYEVYPFYNSSVLPQLPRGNKSLDRRTYIILGVVGGLVLVLIICAIAMGTRLNSAILRRETKIKAHSSVMMDN